MNRREGRIAVPHTVFVYQVQLGLLHRVRQMEIKNVSVKTKANVYHGGNVTSRSVITESGEMKTLGVMLPGTYRFHTDAPEVLDVTQGRCRVKLADAQEWQEYVSGESFDIPAKTQFEIEVSELLDYVCHFG